MHVSRNKIVDLVVGQVALFLACINQLFYVVKFIV